MKLVVDLETNGLFNECTMVHCIGVRDIDSDYNELFEGYELCLSFIENCIYYNNELIFHNGFGFDLPVINKIFGKDLLKTNKIHDTFVLSQLFYGDLKQRDFNEFNIHPKFIGSHSLEAWGYRLKCHKGGFKGPWDTYTKEMGQYCLQDTKVTKQLFNYFESIKYERIERDDCINTEYEIAPIISRQCNNGIYFNSEKANILDCELQTEKIKKRHQLQELFKPRVIRLDEFTPKTNNRRYGTKKGGTYTKIKFEEYNPNSRPQTIDRLCKELGWRPEEFTEKGNPEFDEEIIESLPFEQIKPIKDFYIINKRIGQLSGGAKAWLKSVKSNHRIYGGILQCGTVTGRMSHFSPNLAQVPSVDKPYGTQCRELFCASPGKILIGCDADALEMRCCAGYLKSIDGGTFIETVLKGNKSDKTDMHSIHAEAIGVNRDCAKQFFYALIYGAKNPKLGLILQQHGVNLHEYLINFDIEFKKIKDWSIKKKTGFSDKFLECLIIGKEARKRFGERLPALPKLIEDVTKKGISQGYLKGLDGRKLFCRSEHSMFNTLLQSAGAIIMKRALIIADEKFRLKYVPGKDYEFIINCHDEWQIEVNVDNLELIDYIKSMAKESIKEAGEYYKFPCPMAGNVMVGNNWAETH